MEKLREAKQQRSQPLETDLDGLLKLLVDGDRAPAQRRINPTQRSFIYSSDRIRAYMGPAGCAKTSTGVAAVLLRALLQPGSKHFIARADYNDLLDTTMLRAQEMINRLPPGTLLERNKSAPAKWYIKSVPRRLEDGTVHDEPSQITFFGLKEYPGGYEFNSGFIDEASEVKDVQTVLGLNSRLRYKGGGYSIMMAFNPPGMEHWLYEACTGYDFQNRKVSEPWVTLFRPEPTENVRNLPPNYYEALAASLPEDMRMRFVSGQWGTVFPGKPVFRQFKRAIHVVDRINYVRGATLFRFWDFGYRRPCCLWAMVDELGRLYVMRELLGENDEVRAFARRVVDITQREFAEAERVEDYGDPAVAQKKDTGQALGMLAQEGITCRYKHTPFDLSLQEVRRRFEMLIEGEPAIRIASSCNVLINGMAGGYYLKDDGVTPFKDGFYDHEADALRYGIWNVLGTAGKRFTVPLSVSYRPEADTL